MTPTGYETYYATVIVTSDTCFEDESKDESGSYLVEKLKEHNFSKVTKIIVPDEMDIITEEVRASTKDINNVLTITVGGTGLCPRDVTPEACKVLYDKVCNGMAIALHMFSLRYSPHAALSRLTAGIHGNCLIVNFPGKTKACKECFACLTGFLHHALEQVKFDAQAISKTHSEQDKQARKDHQVNKKKSPSKPKSTSSNMQAKFDRIENTITSPSPSVKSGYTSVPFVKSDANQTSTPSSYVESHSSDRSEADPIEKLKFSNESLEAKPELLKMQQQTSNLLSDSFMSRPTIKSFQTESPYQLCEYRNALNILGSVSYEMCQNRFTSLDIDSLDGAHSALGHILARDLPAKNPVPPFPVSTMDGYVLNIPKSMKFMASQVGPVVVKVVPNYEQFEILRKMADAGENFFCYRVNTGGRIPEENIAIIPVEDTANILNERNKVQISRIKLGCYIRAKGSDLDSNDCLEAGTKIGPVELSLAHAMGYKSIEVVRKPSIGVLSTGDELVLVKDFVEGETDVSKVIDSNSSLLTALYRTRGIFVTSKGIARDNPEEIKLKIQESLLSCDILVISGGASMGTKDHVKDVIESLGGIIHFGRVNMKPGKPVAFASLMTKDKRKYIFSLPGNPVSAYVTSIVLVLPFIEHGMRNFQGTSMCLSLADVGDIISVMVEKITENEDNLKYIFDGRFEFLRAKLSRTEMSSVKSSSFFVSVSIKQQSSRLLNLIGSDCLILIEPTNKGKQLTVGQTYKAIRLPQY